MTTHRQTWVQGAAGSGFDVDNLPFGVFARSGEHPRVAVRIGDQVLDLSVVAAADMVDTHELFDQPTLNPFMAAGPTVWDSTRAWVTGLLTDQTERDLVEPALSPVDSVTMRLPFTVGDYVDFYASEHHASNVGRMFRPDQEPLLPNWKNLPVGYHGRSGTVVVSGTDVIRPCGQRKAPTDDAPTYGPSARLDIEAELGFVVGVPSRARRAGDHRRLRAPHLRRGRPQRLVRPRHPGVGVRPARPVPRQVLRDLHQRLGDPAGRPRRGLDRPAGPGTPRSLDYLRVDGPAGLDIEVEVVLDGEVVSRPPYRTMYWSPAQMLAHTTVNGASVRTGDLWGSGTVSGPERGPARLPARAVVGRQGALHGGRSRADLPRGRRRGDPALHRARDVGWADRARRGHRPDRACSRGLSPRLGGVKQLGQYAAPRHAIAHLSDPHLIGGGRLHYGVVDNVANLRRALDRLAAVDPPPQALVFTGDLADQGEPEAYATPPRGRRAGGRGDGRDRRLDDGQPRRAGGLCPRPLRLRPRRRPGPGARGGRAADRRARHQRARLPPRRAPARAARLAGRRARDARPSTAPCWRCTTRRSRCRCCAPPS